MFLTKSDIAALTGRRAYSAQARALNSMGIVFKKRPDGSLAVLEAHVMKQLGGTMAQREPKDIEPNWDALR